MLLQECLFVFSFSSLHYSFRFSSEMGDRKSRCFNNVGSSISSGKSRNISESLDSNEVNDQGAAGRDGFTRSKWTSSFRRLLGRKSKNKFDRSLDISKTDEPRWTYIYIVSRQEFTLQIHSPIHLPLSWRVLRKKRYLFEMK